MLTKTNEVRIETCTLCNYNCLMCPRDSFKRSKKIMDLDLFKFIINRILESPLNIELVTLSGFGEFSLDPTRKEKIKLIKKNFKDIHIVTNLSNFNLEDMQILLDNITTLRVSLYGRDQKTYQTIHHPPNKIRLKDIEDKVHFFNNYKKGDQQLILSYIELEENKHQTQDWIKHWKNLADNIEVWKPHNWTDGKNYRKISERKMETCGRPFNSPVQIQVDGTVNVCCFDYNGILTIGDLKTESLEEIYNSKLMQKIQFYHSNGLADNIELCKDCDQRLLNKKKNIIFNSKYDKSRINQTSTNYRNLVCN